MPVRTVDVFDEIGIFVESYEVDLAEPASLPSDRSYEREALRLAVEDGLVPTDQLSSLKAIVRPGLMNR
jgi:hypothetical protein